MLSLPDTKMSVSQIRLRPNQLEGLIHIENRFEIFVMNSKKTLGIL
jgi:hypothetical protein